MNVFNRIVVVLLLLCVLAGTLLLAFRFTAAIDTARLALSVSEQGYYDDLYYTLYIAGSVLVIAVSVFLLWLEVRRPRFKTVRVRTSEQGGDAQLSVPSVEQNLAYRVDELAGVRRVQPLINSRGRDVEVTLKVDTNPAVSIPALSNQIVGVCRDVVENQLGLKLHGRVRIIITHEPYPSGARLAARPVVGPAQSEPFAASPTPAELPVAETEVIAESAGAPATLGEAETGLAQVAEPRSSLFAEEPKVEPPAGAPAAQ